MVAIGRPDLADRMLGCVWSGASGRACEEQRLYLFEGAIYRLWPAWGSLSWHFDILDIFVSLSKLLPLIFIIDSSL